MICYAYTWISSSGLYGFKRVLVYMYEKKRLAVALRKFCPILC